MFLRGGQGEENREDHEQGLPLAQAEGAVDARGWILRMERGEEEQMTREVGRAREHATLCHTKTTGKWARGMKGREGTSRDDRMKCWIGERSPGAGW
jgi:hypothetical protein